MSDQSADGHQGTREHFPNRTPRAEFFVYFTVIFLVAIPFAALSWIYSTVTQGHMPDQNAVLRAWSEAKVITPLIFRA